MNDLTLKIENLYAGFFTDRGYVPAVDSVSLQIPKGQVVGIVGESGCGKSMLARSVMGILKYSGRITGGSIRLCGQELVGMPEKKLCALRGRDMAMVFQEPMTSLNPVVPVGKQVREALLLHEKMDRKAAKQEVLQIFERVGISEPEKRYNSYPHQLSGGLRQRIMIAMAMVCKPKLLIADEPTTALDVTIEAQILQLMRQLSKETGMSILMISHNLGVIAQMCDQVYVMYAGKIVEKADVNTLFADCTHPYTKGLMGSVIDLKENPPRLPAIGGMVPNLLHLPEGCAFAPRCPYASARCQKERPSLLPIAQGHECRCFERGLG